MEYNKTSKTKLASVNLQNCLHLLQQIYIRTRLVSFHNTWKEQKIWSAEPQIDTLVKMSLIQTPLPILYIGTVPPNVDLLIHVIPVAIEDEL